MIFSFQPTSTLPNVKKPFSKLLGVHVNQAQYLMLCLSSHFFGEINLLYYRTNVNALASISLRTVFSALYIVNIIYGINFYLIFFQFAIPFKMQTNFVAAHIRGQCRI